MAESVLADSQVWRLKQESWDLVGRSLTAMELALKAGNSPALSRAVANMEMAGPHRIGGLEDCSMLPLPEEYRERVDEMIHILGETPPTRWSVAAPGATPPGPVPTSGS